MSKKVRTLGIKAAQGRVIAHVPLPEASVLGLAQLFPDPEPGAPAINVALLRDHLLREGRVELKAAMEIVKQATEYLDGEPNLVELNAPVTSPPRPLPSSPLTFQLPFIDSMLYAIFFIVLLR